MKLPRSAAVLCTLIVLSVAAQLAAAPLVAPTGPLTPAEQQKRFHLPPGFEIQLVAAEPDIQKPMNLNFDHKGRLWVSHSVEYPFAAKEGEAARDGVTVLSKLDASGKAQSVRRFADGLNIPIGLVPLGGGDSCIVWSIPHIWKLTDTDGDGAADEREVILSGFQYVDTHGNQNGFTRWLDGWIYACHGFRNDSHVTLRGEGEPVLHLNSGNVYRFRPDGSAVERVTHGQVNPFGLCFDALGNIYTSDCHSMPLYMVLRGAHYPSFGKLHDGLGYGPALMPPRGDWGTGLGGACYYAADHFPQAYRDNLFVGNVVNGIVHRVTLWARGSTYAAEPQPDFITCDDPWFRPVDIQLGPDGALYIADFYNKIIGHYEVPLNHPERDRERGRIWRVVYTGPGNDADPQPGDALPGGLPGAIPGAPDLTELSFDELLRQWQRDNLPVRVMATHEMIDRFGRRAARALPQHINNGEAAINWAFAPWVLQRTGSLDEQWIDDLLGEQNAVLDVHTLQALREAERWSWDTYERVRDRMAHGSFVGRAGAEALAAHPHIDNVRPLMELWSSTPAEDTHLVHAVRIALREHMKRPAIVERVAELELSDADRARLAQIMFAAGTDRAAAFLLRYARDGGVAGDELARYVGYIARHIEAGQIGDVASFARERFKDDPGFQLSLFASIRDGLQQRGVDPAKVEALRGWAATIAQALLDVGGERSPRWANHPLSAVQSADGTAEAGGGSSPNPWGIRHRGSTDGDKDAMFFDSIARGEQLTGVLRSAPFELPAKLSFWICGHNGHPNTDPPPRNHIRLLLAESGREIAREIPPRHDTARRVEWDLSKHAGQRGVIEIVDADTGDAYAWIGVGRFSVPALAVPPVDPPDAGQLQTAAVELARQYRLTDATPRVRALLADRAAALATRAAAARAMMQLDRAAALPVVSALVTDAAEPPALRTQAAAALGAVDAEATRQALIDALITAPAPLQGDFAAALAATRAGGEALLHTIAEGKASPQLLQDGKLIERLRAAGVENLDLRVAELTRNLAPRDERIEELIRQRGAGFAAADASPQRGQAVFTKHCAACHRIGDAGAMIAPQLDGIGARGPARLLEDVLDPNRNVDQAFRMTILTTAEGDTIAGLVRREEGQTLIIADAAGKELRIPLAEIDARRVTPMSPMPANFADLIPPDELNDLLAFLLTQRKNDE